MQSNENMNAYAQAGVDIDAASDAVSRMKAHIAGTRTAGVVTDIGSFGGMFALSSLGKMADPVLVSSIDGVGTKLKIVFATGRHDTIGRDLVWHCVNDILVQGARPLFFLDYFGTGKLSPETAAEVVKGLAEGCKSVGCALIGGETAEMPGIYAPGEYDLAGCIVGIVERSEIIDGSRVGSNDVLLGLASDGLHTNGYSLARLALKTDEIDLNSPIKELDGETLGDALLRPHRCYFPAISRIISQKSPKYSPESGHFPQKFGDSPKVKALAHITGGGFIDNIPRVLPDGIGAVIDKNSWPIPPLFRFIQERGNIDSMEMFRVFNMGIGFVAIVAREDAAAIKTALEKAGERVYEIGRTTLGQGVTFS